MSRERLSVRCEFHEGDENNQESNDLTASSFAGRKVRNSFWVHSNPRGHDFSPCTTGQPARHIEKENAGEGMPGDEPTQVFREDESSEGMGTRRASAT